MKNLQNKILITLFALGAILWSCDSFIYDDLEDCPQGVYVKFYSMTPCASSSTFIGSVPSLTVFAFDKNDKLVNTVTQANVDLTADYEVLVPVKDGNFTFIAWAGIDDKFTTSSFTNGKTTKKDVMLTLKSTSSVAANLNGTRIWQGESPTVFLPDPEEYGSFYEHTAVNLRELTNRVNVKVRLDPKVTALTAKDLTVNLSGANGIVNIDGNMPLGTSPYNYPVIDTTYDTAENSVTWSFALMDLQTGYNNVLRIDYPAKNQLLFNNDLIGAILLNTLGENINLRCENDFNVEFILRDYCASCATHFSCTITVNDYPVHSYEIEL